MTNNIKLEVIKGFIMKKSITALISIILSLATLLSLVSCGEDVPDGYVKYEEYGFSYMLPVEMDKKTVSYAAICHSNREATLMVDYLEAESLEEMEIDPNITIKRYADKFLLLNDYDDTVYTYDEERDRVYFFAEKTFEKGEANEETVLYYHLLMRNDYVIYIVTLYCDISLKDKYTPIFLEWADYMSILK